MNSTKPLVSILSKVFAILAVVTYIVCILITVKQTVPFGTEYYAAYLFDIVLICLGIIPSIVLLVSVFQNKKVKRTGVIVAISSFLAISLVTYVTDLIVIFKNSYLSVPVLIKLLLRILFITLSIIILVDIVRKFKNVKITKVLTIILISIFGLMAILFIGQIFGFFSGLSSTFFWLSILFVIYEFVLWQAKKVNPNKGLESELVYLKQQFELGNLSEADYKQKKSDIISKL